MNIHQSVSDAEFQARVQQMLRAMRIIGSFRPLREHGRGLGNGSSFMNGIARAHANLIEAGEKKDLVKMRKCLDEVMLIYADYIWRCAGSIHWETGRELEPTEA